MINNFFFKPGTGSPSAYVDNEAWVYFMFGQSNIFGNSPVGNLTAPLDDTIPNSYIFFKPVSTTDNNATYSADNGSWEPLSIESNQLTDYLGTFYGPELKMAYDLQDYYNRDIYILKFSIGDTSLSAEGANATAGLGGDLDWWPGSINELFKKGMQDFWLQGKQKLIEAGLKPVPKGILWGQGEHDASVSAFSSAWGANCRELRRVLREWLGDPNLHFCVARMPNETLPPGGVSRPFAQAIYDVQSVIGAEANCSWIDTDAYTMQGDGAHFADHSQLGADAAAKFIAANP